jgi:hypothetical protein
MDVEASRTISRECSWDVGKGRDRLTIFPKVEQSQAVLGKSEQLANTGNVLVADCKLEVEVEVQLEDMKTSRAALIDLMMKWLVMAAGMSFRTRTRPGLGIS